MQSNLSGAGGGGVAKSHRDVTVCKACLTESGLEGWGAIVRLLHAETGLKPKGCPGKKNAETGDVDLTNTRLPGQSRTTVLHVEQKIGACLPQSNRLQRAVPTNWRAVPVFSLFAGSFVLWFCL